MLYYLRLVEMNNYPNYIPSELIRYYEFELTSDIEKTIIEKLIFDERMAFIWSALEKRANEMTVPYFFYQSLVLNISFFVEGPNDWELLTHKEKKQKIEKISNLSRLLSRELEGTPLDTATTEYSNNKYYIDWFLNHSNDDFAKRRMNTHLDKFFELKNREYCKKDNVDIDFSSVWMVAGVSAPRTSVLLNELHIKADGYEVISVIKRKTNPKKSYFIRRLAAFFDKCFEQKLYNITAAISSVFLDEEVTQEDVVSITK